MTAVLVWTGLVVAGLGHALLWLGVANRLHGYGFPRPLVKAIVPLAGIGGITIIVLVVQRFLQRGDATFNPFAVRDAVGVYVWICATIGAGAFVVKPWVEAQRYDRTVLRNWTADRRDVVKALGRAPLHSLKSRLLAALPFNEAMSLSIDRKKLAIPRLPAELEGLTIVHLSDLHMTGDVGQEFFDYMVRQVNDLRPDVIAITGDIIEEHACYQWIHESLAKLCAPLGVYFVLGNHDVFIDVRRTLEELKHAGLIHVGARPIRADWNGVPVTMLGNEAPWLPGPKVGELPARRAGVEEFRLALVHSPDRIAWGRQVDADLVLAGHTHGGQIQLPILGVVASPSIHGARYACGVFRRGDTVLHVSRGVSGETPLRWRCPPEIALLELTAMK
ncbi:metallophosphoesterase [Lacipirellula sp.]|uniref:metallophosphoesterase n=1 Tax=Lacipirellula sp. TaxID=2691419 RepID=UPI003D1529FD